MTAPAMSGSDGQHEEHAGDHDHPRGERDVVGLHPGRARVHQRDDEVDTAEQEGHEFQRDGNEPHRGSYTRLVVITRRRQRRVGRPRTAEAASLHEQRRQQDERADEEDLEREAVDAREHHVVRADHERNQVVPEGGDEHGHRHPEDHDRSVVRDERVVLARRDLAEARHADAGEGQLHPEHVGHEAPDHGHEHAREEVLHGDDLVIGRPDVLQDPRGTVVRVGVRPVVDRDSGVSHLFLLPYWAAEVEFSAIHWACVFASWIWMRAAMMP
jgi:hypothetical protein